jgi:hypothetical protein
LHGLLDQGEQAKQFLNLCVENSRIDTIFTLHKQLSYGRSIVVAFLCGDFPIHTGHHFTVDFPQQDGEQKQTRQQVLIRLSFFFHP